MVLIITVRSLSLYCATGSTLYQSEVFDCSSKDPSYTGDWYCAEMTVRHGAYDFSQIACSITLNCLDMRIIHSKSKELCGDEVSFILSTKCYVHIMTTFSTTLMMSVNIMIRMRISMTCAMRTVTVLR